MIWAARKIVDAIGYKQYNETGCPECGTKGNYVIIRTSDMAMIRCGNPKCAVAFPVTFEEDQGIARRS